MHATPPYRWQRCEALLFPNMLRLTWLAPGGGQGVVTLDLLNCIEVRSTFSLTHSEVQDDVGTIAALAQARDPIDKDDELLMEMLSPFQLLYGDGTERLAAGSSRERVRWVGAVWYVPKRLPQVLVLNSRI